MTLYYQLDNKIGLLVAKVAQKLTFQLGHFKFRPLEKVLTFLRGTWGLGMVPGTRFHYQNALAEEWSRNWGI